MRYWSIVLAALLLSSTVRAEDEIGVVIFAPKPEETGVRAELPFCDDSRMLNEVATLIREYQQAHPAASIVSRRKQMLLLKNLKWFEEIPVADFDNTSNYEVARELVMTKINYKINESKMRLCRGNRGSDIYLLMYPEGTGARVQILNFVPAPESGNEFSVYYEQPVESTALQTESVTVDSIRQAKAEQAAEFKTEPVADSKPAEQQQSVVLAEDGES